MRAVLFLTILIALAQAKLWTIALDGPCNKAVEVAITSSETNTSDTSSCGVPFCTFEDTTSRFTCNITWSLGGGGGEVIVAAHIHWLQFTLSSGTVVASDKYVFALGGGAGFPQGLAWADIVADTNLTRALLGGPTATAGTFYVNIHTNWSPPSPKGAVAGKLRFTTNSLASHISMASILVLILTLFGIVNMF